MNNDGIYFQVLFGFHQLENFSFITENKSSFKFLKLMSGKGSDSVTLWYVFKKNNCARLADLKKY